MSSPEPTVGPAPEQASYLQPRGWALQRRLSVALLVLGALLLGIVAAAVVLQFEIRQTQQNVVRNYYDGLRTSQDYFIDMLDSETAVRGYVLTHDRRMLVPLEKAGAPWDHPISAQVLTKLPAEEQSVRSLRTAETAAAVWYRDWAAPVIAQAERGQTPSTPEVFRGKQLFDNFRDSYQTYISQLRPERKAAADHLHQVTNLLFITVLSAALIAVVGGFGFWTLLRRWVSRPVAYLANEARLVSSGDLNHEVSALGPPEFVRLGRDVEAMRERLVAQIEQVEQAGQQVAAARARLEEQTLELQRSNRELEQFAYVASHDLQEPLRKVASFCQMLERRYSGQLDERADQYIHFAVDGAKRMQQLINDLLEFSRVGRVSTPLVDVDLNDCLRNALFSLEAAREEAAAEITAADLPTVHGEAPLLTQLLQNLIGNAIKFRSQEPPRITITAGEGDGFWEFSCTDNGIGIEPEYADRVFLIFQRLHAKEVYTGTGIGLAMCKKIVEYHGGRIWVDESPRTEPGTTIHWTLPVAPVVTNAEVTAPRPETVGPN